MAAPLAGVRALLVDLEGTLFQAGGLIPGAAAALEAAASRGVSCGFVTNTTSRPRSVLVAELDAMGFTVSAERVFTAPLANTSSRVSFAGATSSCGPPCSRTSPASRATTRRRTPSSWETFPASRSPAGSTTPSGSFWTALSS